MDYKAIKWDVLERGVVERIRCLKAACDHLPDDPLKDKLYEDLIVPNVRLLAAFCAAVTIEDESEGE